MNRPSKAASAAGTWCWRRWIRSDQQEMWIARLEAVGCVTWTLTERPDRVRILLAVYQKQRAGVVSLFNQFGGQVGVIKDSAWIKPGPTPPTRIGQKLEIVHEQVKTRGEPELPRLHIPHGMAFGSGDHATTFMLLRALTLQHDWNASVSVLDLGTGSGVLALAARLFGAGKIVATDFDPEAVRTARQNEALNFSTPLVRWRCADVKRLRAGARYDLVLANLFSGILCEAAPQITGAVASGGQLWLSGILRSQEKSVIAVYRRQRLQPIRTVTRGKWVMLQWRKVTSTKPAAEAPRKPSRQNNRRRPTPGW